ncbi:MAG: hypothetical protein ACREQV_05880, partial [Candidatus Binatia bacterium]
HVPQLDSVRVLLSDEPAMETQVSFYQRLLAMDLDEATDILRRYLSGHSREEAYEEMLLPVLSYAKADLRQNNITEREHQFVMNATRNMLEKIAHEQVSGDAGDKSPAGGIEGDARKIPIVICPAQGGGAEIALLMLRQLLNPARYEFAIISAGTLASEIAAIVAEKNPPLVCIAALSPGGLAQVRYLCKRLRAVSSDIKIVIGRWGLSGDTDSIRESLVAAGADQIGRSLCQTRDQITNLRPFISPAEGSAQSGAPAHAIQRAATSS